MEPPEGHFERFQLKMEAVPVKRKWLTWRTGLEIAAVVLIVVLATNQAAIYLKRNKPVEARPLTLSSISAEYREVEFYYTSAITQGLKHWETLRLQGMISPEEQKAVEAEMKEFDETYTRLQQELGTNPADERVINAMLEVYQSKLSIITLITEKLEALKQQKKAKNDKEI